MEWRAARPTRALPAPRRRFPRRTGRCPAEAPLDLAARCARRRSARPRTARARHRIAAARTDHRHTLATRRRARAPSRRRWCLRQLEPDRDAVDDPPTPTPPAPRSDAVAEDADASGDRLSRRAPAGELAPRCASMHPPIRSSGPQGSGAPPNWRCRRWGRAVCAIGTKRDPPASILIRAQGAAIGQRPFAAMGRRARARSRGGETTGDRIVARSSAVAPLSDYNLHAPASVAAMRQSHCIFFAARSILAAAAPASIARYPVAEPSGDRPPARRAW
jgi:hypothetical protein